jgi:hypothetical protein
VIGEGPALAVGSIDRGPNRELSWVVMAKDGGAITVEPVSNLKGSGDYVTGQQKAHVAEYLIKTTSKSKSRSKMLSEPCTRCGKDATVTGSIFTMHSHAEFLPNGIRWLEHFRRRLFRTTIVE